MKSISLYKKIDSLPDNLKEEANNFIDFLLSKKQSHKKIKSRKAGFLRGQFEISADFDEPLDDFKTSYF